MVKKKRTASSARWIAEHESDIYVRMARERNYRSRARFKLEELDARDHLLKPGMTVVDLGAAPGGWSQYARPRLGAKGRLVALDVLPMEPLAGVDFIEGDFRTDAVLAAFEACVGNAGVDLVLSDMAPNISGVTSADQAAAMELAELALDFACRHLCAQGALLMKLFSGEGCDAFVASVRQHFGKVVIRKPKASRARSRELYLLARSFRVV
ncbi:MAG: 23S rRNA (uridine(2552)-2'-O)-methyltransferase RlmE [Nevskiaceae bacterium]|nr:MAG: 23S rRNA (uridine(2552)-2'-O)-methyltransferase RlmE [Nevskiaceae bacterium]TBR74144.1 MAG: 23S rRNA (uridine(2552)-2'-O)-methyltransferase RlmE [Nevskiaceae bacterium]